MTLTKIEAVILKTQPYGDTSLIVRLYSRELGKISGIAKGARRPRSPLGGILDNLNYVGVILYFKETRDLHTIKECDLLDPFPGLRENLDRTAVGLALTELMYRTALEGASQPALFQALVDTLRAVARAERHVRNFYWAFALRLLEESGTRLAWEACAGCGAEPPAGTVQVSLEHGGVLCPVCAGSMASDAAVGTETRCVGAHLAGCSLDRAANLQVSSRAAGELQQLLTRYMRYHLTGFRESVSLKMLSE